MIGNLGQGLNKNQFSTWVSNNEHGSEVLMGRWYGELNLRTDTFNNFQITINKNNTLGWQ